MSQAKVDQYKEFKKNRKEFLEKEKKSKKVRLTLWKLAGLLAALALVVALGVTVFNVVKARIGARPDYAREQLVLDDVVGIFVTEAATTEGGTDTEPESTEADVESTAAAPETTVAP